MFNESWVHNHAGHFLPEEDDKFLEKVRAAVEEEERQAMAAADTDAAKDAIATAEEFRRNLTGCEHDLEDANSTKNVENNESQDKITETVLTEKENHRSEGRSHGGAYDSVASLPIEFYHYYHGSNTDMGTLIEVILISSLSISTFLAVYFVKVVSLNASHFIHIIFSVL